MFLQKFEDRALVPEEVIYAVRRAIQLHNPGDRNKTIEFRKLRPTHQVNEYPYYKSLSTIA